MLCKSPQKRHKLSIQLEGLKMFFDAKNGSFEPIFKENGLLPIVN